MDYDIKMSGARIRDLRIQGNLTQEALAKQLSIDRSLLSHIEAGKRGCSVDLLVRLSSFFEVSLDFLVMGKVHSDFLSDHRNQMNEDVELLISHLEAFKKALQAVRD